MPNLFLSGMVSFNVRGSVAQVKAVKKSIKNDEHGLKFSYTLNGTPYTFYIHPWHVVNGVFTIKPIDEGFEVEFNGTGKVPIEKASFDYLLQNDAELYIAGVLGDGYMMSPDAGEGSLIKSPLKLTKSPPKNK